MADTSEHLPDLTREQDVASLADGQLLAGRVGDERVIVWREGDGLHAYGATCTHLGAPLDEGLVSGSSIHCPWHHACFELRSGRALAAPAFDPLPRCPVEVRDGRFTVGAPQAADVPAMPAVHRGDAGTPMVIVGGGAAGFAAADTLRKENWTGEIVVLSADADAPYDRTLLTKDVLDGQFGEDRLPIARQTLASIGVDLRLKTEVEAIDAKDRSVRLRGGRTQRYGKLLLATGAEPRVPRLDGIRLPHVHTLRSAADCRAILRGIEHVRRVVIIGGSFIGLEAAASLRTRGLTIDVVTPDRHPLEKVFGRALSDAVVDVHRHNGVTLHLGCAASRIASDGVTLDDGRVLPADLVVVGVGVEPRLALAETAGLAIERGILVDPLLRTSRPDIFAAGDIARWPDPHGGQAIRVEHWVVAERQGQIAARNMLGAKVAFTDVPFFWTKHFDLSIRLVGHAEVWDDVTVEGDIAQRNGLVRYRKGGRDAAIATVERERTSLQAELQMTRRLASA